MRWIILSVTLFFGSMSLSIAQDLEFTYGKVSGHNGTTYMWGFKNILYPNTPLHVSWGYENEGHVAAEHRDGMFAQVEWVPFDFKHFRPYVSAGPYVWSATEPRGSSTVDRHGVGIIQEAGVRYLADDKWSLSVNSTQIFTSESVKHGVAAGCGYSGTMQPFKLDCQDKLYISGFQTINNTYMHQDSNGCSAEYMHNFTPTFALSGAYLQEGDTGFTNRSGLAVESWFTFEYISLGVGPYFSSDHGRRATDALVSLAAVFPTKYVGIRPFWHRILTTNSRDADLFGISLGLKL